MNPGQFRVIHETDGVEVWCKECDLTVMPPFRGWSLSIILRRCEDHVCAK